MSKPPETLSLRSIADQVAGNGSAVLLMDGQVKPTKLTLMYITDDMVDRLAGNVSVARVFAKHGLVYGDYFGKRAYLITGQVGHKKFYPDKVIAFNDYSGPSDLFLSIQPN